MNLKFMPALQASNVCLLDPGLTAWAARCWPFRPESFWTKLNQYPNLCVHMVISGVLPQKYFYGLLKSLFFIRKLG